MSAQSSTSGSVNARATDNAEDEQPQKVGNQQAPVGSATGTASDCVPDDDNSTQTEAIAGPSGQAPNMSQIILLTRLYLVLTSRNGQFHRLGVTHTIQIYKM